MLNAALSGRGTAQSSRLPSKRWNTYSALSGSPRQYIPSLPLNRPAVHAASAQTTDTEYSIDISKLRLLLGKEGNQRQVLRGVDLKIKRGSLHMLLGPNGCGKSTLLKVLGGLIWPYTGKVNADSPSGFVFQNPDHQVVMPTVGADVAFGLGR